MNIFERLQDFFSLEQPPTNQRIIDGQVTVKSKNQRNGPRTAAYRPAKKDILTFNALINHPDFDKNSLKQGNMALGIDKRTDKIKQSTHKSMTTGIIAGRRNYGKSMILKNHILLALHAKQAGLNCNVIFCDPHHNLPDACGTFFKPILDQFDMTFLGMESLERGYHLKLFKDLKAQMQSYQQTGFDQSAPWWLIYVDEADLFFKAKNGKQTYQFIEHLVNLRKGRIFFLLSFADTTKSGAGGHGTSLVAAGSTVFCVNYDATRARRILGDDGRKAFNLPVGQAVVKIPDEKASVCHIPLVTEQDLKPFMKK